MKRQFFCMSSFCTLVQSISCLSMVLFLNQFFSDSLKSANLKRTWNLWEIRTLGVRR